MKRHRIWHKKRNTEIQLKTLSDPRLKLDSSDQAKFNLLQKLQLQKSISPPNLIACERMLKPK